MIKIKKIISIFLSFSFLLTSCEKVQISTYQVGGYFIDSEYVFPLNTINQITTYYEKNREDIQTYFQQQVIELGKLFDRYHLYDGMINLKTINDSCGKGITYLINEHLYEAIKLGVKMTKLSKGRFNLAMGKIIDLYQPFFYEGKTEYQSLPEKSLIDQALLSIPSYEEVDSVIKLDDEKKSIQLNLYHGKVVCLSLGSIAKGYIMDCMVSELKKWSLPMIIDAGNSTMALLLQNPITFNHVWKIGLKDPLLNQSSNTLCQIQTTGDTFISTSGDYTFNFYYQDKNKKARLMHHIIDPFSGISNNTFRMVNVLSNDAPLAILDAITTAIFNYQDSVQIIDFLNQIKQQYSCHLEVLLVRPIMGENEINFNEYVIEMSSGYQKLLCGDFVNHVREVKEIEL